MKYNSFEDSTLFGPTELADIFYDEAHRIAGNEDDARKLTKEALTEFLSHYRSVKKRSKT